MRSLTLSNGSLMITLDEFGELRDLYFPHVGLENHTEGGLRHRVGVYVDGELSWLSADPSWDITVTCKSESLASMICARNSRLQVEITAHDVVYNESAIFLRNITVKNTSSFAREIKLYFGHQFNIFGSKTGNTGYYDPELEAIVHYKGKRVFLISGKQGGKIFSDYAVGLVDFENKEGTHVDAEDGILSKNPIEHGPVDSVIGFYSSYEPEEERVTEYWMTAGTSIFEAKKLHEYVIAKTPAHLIKTTEGYWKAWVNRYDWNFSELSPAAVALFKKSLMFVRAHVDDEGGIIASTDSDILQHGKDTYAYVWPRDAVYSALCLARAGDPNVARRFFIFCKNVIAPPGYFMHKYLPDGSLGSSWHPWVKNAKPQLPIQEDETALVVWSLYEHYLHSRDLEFIESIYNPLIEKAADFLASFRTKTTGLPNPSYDLWEEQHGISTYTACAVYGALQAAAEIAKLLGKEDREHYYKEAASEVRVGILTHLYDAKQNQFYKMIRVRDGIFYPDSTHDISSVYGVFSFGVLPPHDPRLVEAFANTVEVLSKGITVSGIARYENDYYYRKTPDASNPWFITSLWHAEFLIAKATSNDELDAVRSIFAWVCSHALPSGVLSEQIDPRTGKPLSVAPLTWSHSAYVNAILKYLDKLEALGICTACNPVQ